MGYSKDPSIYSTIFYFLFRTDLQGSSALPRGQGRCSTSMAVKGMVRARIRSDRAEDEIRRRHKLFYILIVQYAEIG
jgi:hypothetical protein